MTSEALWAKARMLEPKLIATFKQGYSLDDFRRDLIAGLTVAIVALPLSMALAIASGATPDKGLYTAVVGGFLISALGGSRFQIGGPTGAFVVVVFGVIQQHGYDGLVLATLLAGLMLIFAGLAGLGTLIKYLPQPVVIGVTSAIALIIFSGQMKDLFGLKLASMPANILEQWSAFWTARDSVSLAGTAVALAALAVILLARRFAPKLPGFLIAVVGSSLAVYALHLPIETIGTRFGGIPNSLPMPELPAISFERVRELLPSAFTIAFLAGMEALLSAVIADGMTGRRHRSNCELVAQGVANVASALFGGLPATGALARTATNIRAGARSPIAGMLHAVFLLLFMLAFAPLAVFIPLASLAAVLVMVAWNMSERHHFGKLLAASVGDRLVLLVTFGLAVFVDLTMAIGVGVVLASLQFMHRIAQTVAIEPAPRGDLPATIEVFSYRGPFFFGAMSKLGMLLDGMPPQRRVLILRMEDVSMMDASGAGALGDFFNSCHKQGIKVILAATPLQARATLQQMDASPEHHGGLFADDYRSALTLAAKLS